MTHYDLVIVGSGSGNSLVTPELVDRRIAIVEEGTFGGTCLNVGCIPTKMFVYPANLAAEAREWSRVGLQGPVPQAEWKAIRDRVFGRIDPISAGGRDYRATGTPNVTLYEAHAEFTAPRTLQLSTGETLTAEHIVLATGSRVDVPQPIADSGVPYETSDTIMRVDEVPERLVIIGSGYIAAEFAHVFSAFGSRVTMLSRSSLLRGMDEDLTSRLHTLNEDRWHIHTDIRSKTLEEVDGEIRATADNGVCVAGDLLLVATGRRPNGDRLNLAAGGIDADDDGLIAVDEYQRTSAPGVWALGDASNEYQLKHVANHEERVVAHNLAHPDDLVPSDHRFVPAAVFTYPQLASVGLTEQQARESGRRYVTKIQQYGDTAYGWAMEDTTSFCKLIADPATGQLLGAHLMGEHASTLIQPIIQAMSFGLDVRQMARGQYWIHPALSEVVENALLGLELD